MQIPPAVDRVLTYIFICALIAALMLGYPKSVRLQENEKLSGCFVRGDIRLQIGKDSFRASQENRLVRGRASFSKDKLSYFGLFDPPFKVVPTPNDRLEVDDGHGRDIVNVRYYKPTAQRIRILQYQGQDLIFDRLPC
ncbi:hypothetical protein H9L12_00925 [Sphingomonas rhizophila]|uniref:Uncharacterized protein n=1 Tax=Sphingomonas rhizophila TaxID=2071607 RepID=A0A7G9SBM0_9SPHN|nr:hypothetical protein [Sphingomonas rhizophila]QNN65245.1 hypothetical protein H9L12_00925 [Sphingomonas rhizophila]